MNNLLIDLIPAAAFLIGGIIGYLFGTIQNIALIRNKKRSESGKLKTGFLVMPGSFSRIAILMIILVLVQVGLPIFFRGNIQWIVSAGLILGYGWTMLKRLRNRSAFHA